MTMKERIADALLHAIAQTGRGDDLKLKDMNTLARAALAAMREPTETMMAAAERAEQSLDWGTDDYGYVHWRAMIDAAIAE